MKSKGGKNGVRTRTFAAKTVRVKKTAPWTFASANQEEVRLGENIRDEKEKMVI